MRLDLGAPDRELAEATGVLGQLDLEGAFATDSLGGGLGSGRGSGSLGSPGTQQSTGGLGSTQPTATEPASSGVRGTGKGSSAGGGATVSMGDDPVIVGPLDRSLVDAAIERIMNQIRYCYLRELTKHPELGGRIVVELEIAQDGTVSSATTKASTVNNEAVEGCVNGRFLRLAFPSPEGGGTVLVTYPFEFQPG